MNELLNIVIISIITHDRFPCPNQRYLSADPIEMQAVYEEERAKLLLDISQKNQLLNKTLEELKVCASMIFLWAK